MGYSDHFLFAQSSYDSWRVNTVDYSNPSLAENRCGVSSAAGNKPIWGVLACSPFIHKPNTIFVMTIGSFIESFTFSGNWPDWHLHSS